MATQAQPRLMFVNLAYPDLRQAIEFFRGLGFTFDERFTDESATCMVVGDQAFAMLHTQERFKDFTKKEIADATRQSEALIAISAESRDAVDEMADKALAAGAREPMDRQDHGWMYYRTFEDPAGHHWEVVWMDEAQAAEQA